MVLVDITFKAPVEEIDKHLKKHGDFLNSCIEKGVLLVSGRKNPRTGGILVLNLDSISQAEELVKGDAFYGEMADYTLTEFTFSRCDPLLESLRK